MNSDESKLNGKINVFFLVRGMKMTTESHPGHLTFFVVITLYQQLHVSYFPICYEYFTDKPISFIEMGGRPPR